MMVIYPPVKFEFDGKKRWSPETEMLTTNRQKTDERMDKIIPISEAT